MQRQLRLKNKTAYLDGTMLVSEGAKIDLICFVRIKTNILVQKLNPFEITVD